MIVAFHGEYGDGLPFLFFSARSETPDILRAPNRLAGFRRVDLCRGLLEEHREFVEGVEELPTSLGNDVDTWIVHPRRDQAVRDQLISDFLHPVEWHVGGVG